MERGTREIGRHGAAGGPWIRQQGRVQQPPAATHHRPRSTPTAHHQGVYSAARHPPAPDQVGRSAP